MTESILNLFIILRLVLEVNLVKAYELMLIVVVWLIMSYCTCLLQKYGYFGLRDTSFKKVHLTVIQIIKQFIE